MDFKALLIAVGALLVLSSTFFLFHKESTMTLTQDSMAVKFDAWLQKYNVKMASPEEEKYRLAVFTENYEKIQNHPASSSYKLGENQFMIITKQEFKAIHLGLKGDKPKAEKLHLNNGVTASDVDWRKKGAVNPVKDQAQCGSCWAFSTVGALEGADFLKNGELRSFSEQDLVDCSTSYGNQGCNGGLMDQAFSYVKDKGIASEASYPYKAVDQKCKKSTSIFSISGYTDVPSGDCDSLLNALNQQPVAIGVDAEEWQFYSGGVFNNCGSNLDHGVVLIGYESANNAYIVRNSWGASWGESGYIRLSSGNTCGICNTASYPQA